MQDLNATDLRLLKYASISRILSPQTSTPLFVRFIKNTPASSRGALVVASKRLSSERRERICFPPPEHDCGKNQEESCQYPQP